MRTTVTLDDELLEKASRITSIESRSQLLNEALRRLIASEAARRLRLLAGSAPGAKAPPRRRFVPGTPEFEDEDGSLELDSDT